MTNNQQTKIPVRVSCGRERGRYRAGVHWTGTTDAQVSAEQLAELEADTALSVVRLDQATPEQLDIVAAVNDMSPAQALDVAREVAEAVNAKLERESIGTIELVEDIDKDLLDPEQPEPEPTPDPTPQPEPADQEQPQDYPEDFPLISTLQAAGKTYPEVLALAEQGQLATIHGIGATSAAEIQAWIDSNSGGS